MTGPDAGIVRKRSVVIAGHRTSVSMEQAFWDELKRIADREGRSLGALITEVDKRRSGNLSSALRVHVLQDLRAVIASEDL